MSSERETTTESRLPRYWLLELSGLLLLSTTLTLLSWNLREQADLDSFSSNLWRAGRMTLTYVALPLTWLRWRGRALPAIWPPQQQLLFAMIAGVAVYSVALGCFIWALGQPDFDARFAVVGRRRGWDLVRFALLFGYMALLTDWFVRGFLLPILLQGLTTPLALGISLAYWTAIHVYEIGLLQPALGWIVAVALTLFLGLAGDLIVIRYRTWWGPGIGHIWLNWAFIAFLLIR